MSYSTTIGGPINQARKDLATGYHMNSREGRLFAALANTQLDFLEAEGSTHVKINASGHSGSHNISISRDTTAEADHKAATEGAEFDAFFTKGIESGFLREGWPRRHSYPNSGQIEAKPIGSNGRGRRCRGAKARAETSR